VTIANPPTARKAELPIRRFGLKPPTARLVAGLTYADVRT